MADSDDRLSKMLDALHMADQDAKGKPRPCRGQLICPLCGGTVHYHYGTRRNDFRMACETQGCLRAMS
jgi:hypothetical protein